MQQQKQQAQLQQEPTIHLYRLVLHYSGISNGAEDYIQNIWQWIKDFAPNVALRKDFHVNFRQKTMFMDFVQANDAKKICEWINQNIEKFSWKRFACTEAKLVEVKF